MYHIIKDKRSIQSSKWIYTSLTALMLEKKYTDITITEVAEKAIIGRSTFYRSFDSLDDVLRLKCDTCFNELYIYLLEYYKANSFSAKEEKMVFLKPFLRYWYVDSSIVEFLILANKLEIFNESFAEMFKLFLPNLNKSHTIIANYLDYYIAVRSGVAINVLLQWIRNGKDVPPDDLADLIVSNVNELINLDLIL